MDLLLMKSMIMSVTSEQAVKPVINNVINIPDKYVVETHMTRSDERRLCDS